MPDNVIHFPNTTEEVYQRIRIHRHRSLIGFKALFRSAIEQLREMHHEGIISDSELASDIQYACMSYKKQITKVYTRERMYRKTGSFDTKGVIT